MLVKPSEERSMAPTIVPQNIAVSNNTDAHATPSLWVLLWEAMWELRPAFARIRSFLWFTLIVAGLTIHTDTLGVASIMRALKLQDRCYDILRKQFHGNGVCLDKLTSLWALLVLRLFTAPALCSNGRRVFVGDGIKVGKCGTKMPAVRSLHQQSAHKPPYIMGHSYQMVSLLVHAGKSVIAVPLAARIHEGIVVCNAHKQTLLTKMLTLLDLVAGNAPYIFVADAYYAASAIILGMLKRGNHVVTRVRNTAVANVPYAHQGPRQRGRPKRYGRAIKLASLLERPKTMQQAVSQLYGENNVTLRYAVRDLLWRPVGKVVRFVAVVHPTRGKWLLLCTDTSLDAVEIIRLYGRRFKIEHTFKQAVHTIGTFCYRFWMQTMEPVRRGDGNQYLHRQSRAYRHAVERKLRAYHVYVQAAIIAQGLVQYLAATFPEAVWKSFGSWLRTIRSDVAPSEFVVAEALRSKLPHFLASSKNQHPLAKFIMQNQDIENAGIFSMVA